MALPEFIIVKAHEYSRDGIKSVEIPVSAEYSVTLKINNSSYVSIACSGSDMEDLAAGHLISEGIIKNFYEIKDIEINETNLEINVNTVINDEILNRLFRIHSITSGCGQGRVSVSEIKNYKNSSLPVINPSVITSCMKKFLQSSKMHKLTRGVHSAVLLTIDGKEIITFDEIGRHNAIDKIIGYSAKNGHSLRDKMILSTGRLSSEILYKAIYASAPVIISKAAPTSLSVELAAEYNIILIGKVTGNKFSIFNGKDSIK